jgi:type IV fimbrial biogenesis protein FimT
MTASLRGFTLIECLVCLSLLDVLLGAGVPALQRPLQARAVTALVAAFLSDLRLARAEALRRGGPVVMCRSASPEAAEPSCASLSDSTGTGWASGWIVFVDQDRDGQRGAAEELLRVQAGNRAVGSIAASGHVSRFRFVGTGRLFNLASATTLDFGDPLQLPASARRTVCVSIGGRGRIAGDGSANCTGAA